MSEKRVLPTYNGVTLGGVRAFACKLGAIWMTGAQLLPKMANRCSLAGGTSCAQLSAVVDCHSWYESTPDCGVWALVQGNRDHDY